MKTMIHVGGGASTANREPDQGVNEHPECRAHRHGAHKNIVVLHMTVRHHHHSASFRVTESMPTMIHRGGGVSNANREPHQDVNVHQQCRPHHHGARKNRCSPVFRCLWHLSPQFFGT